MFTVDTSVWNVALILTAVTLLYLKCKELAGGRIGTRKTRVAVQLENLDILFRV